MATWKKVIVSGSVADLANVQNAGIASNQVVVGAGAGANQVGKALTAGQILMGNASAVPTGTSVSGDITLSNAGVATIGSDKVTTAMLSGSIADTPVAGQTVKVGANGAFTFDDASTLLSAGKGIDIPANNKISASIDDTTINFDGSEQLQVKDLGIAAGKIAADAVITAKILDANVTTAKIADANITTAKIADANITTAKIADDNVTTAKILDANVTTAKITDDAVTTAKILDANVTTAKLADDAVTAAKLASNAVVNASIDATAAIDFSKLAALSSANLLVGNGSNVATSVALSGDATIDNAGALTIANDAVDGNKLADNITIAGNLTVTSDLIVNGTTTEVRTANLNIEDKFILLQSGSATAAAGDVGIIFGGVSATPTGDSFVSGQGSSLFVDKQLQRLSLSNGAVSSGATTAAVGAHIPLVTTGSLAAITQVGNFKVDASGDLFVYAG